MVLAVLQNVRLPTESARNFRYAAINGCSHLGSASFGRREKSRFEIEDELLKAVEEAKKVYEVATDTARGAVEQKYRAAIEQLNRFVLDHKIPDK